ncbi:MAG: hypothetical protein V7739_11365 [Motiliproteus sp.]
MCTRGYLARLEQDLSYTIWRSSVHQYSAAEVAAALDTLKSEAIKRCPTHQVECHLVVGIFEAHRAELEELSERAKNNPDRGLVDKF